MLITFIRSNAKIKRIGTVFLWAFVALGLACPTILRAQLPSSNPQLQAAREAYFASVSGDRAKGQTARSLFNALNREHPNTPLITAYLGSLDLLDSARTWEFWKIHELSQQGLRELDQAVNSAPDQLEVRFIRAATTIHLPFFFNRKQQSEEDFSLIAPKVEAAAARNELPPPIAAAALLYHGKMLEQRGDRQGAQAEFRIAARIAPDSPPGKDAATRIH